MANTIIWADIPVADMERAVNFYSQLLGMEIVVMPGTGDSVAVPTGGGEGDISFDLAKGETFVPGAGGIRVYFDPKGDMDGAIARAKGAGGTLVQAPTDMGPVVGTIAFLRDSEGNTIGLRGPSSMPPDAVQEW